jgi:RNA polymerase sigma-70 factor (ECF subfamily)
MTFLNNKKSKWTVYISAADETLLYELEADKYFNANEVQLKFQKSLLTLPSKQRLVFNMKYFDELTYEQISEIVGTSVGALKASYHHAVKKIEKYFEENEGF